MWERIFGKRYVICDSFSAVPSSHSCNQIPNKQSLSDALNVISSLGPNGSMYYNNYGQGQIYSRKWPYQYEAKLRSYEFIYEIR